MAAQMLKSKLVMLLLTLAKNMAAKLIVHKYDSDSINFKSLHIKVVDDDDAQNSETIFTKWYGGKAPQKKKDADKSSRLVVKIISGSEESHFDLDACSQEIKTDTSIDITNPNFAIHEISPGKQDNNSHSGNGNQSNIMETTSHQDGSRVVKSETITTSKPRKNSTIELETIRMNSDNLEENSVVSPLEYSLERVKENNARIMKNIQMLNRTLNYTKQKEIFCVNGRKSSFPCNVCGKCFVYETGLKRHCSMRHSMAEMQPRWQTVWTCIECAQVWPRQDLALQHTSRCCKSNSPDCVREIKTSSLLQCEFCERVFTSIPQLLRHSEVHTTANNYECNVCDLGFRSYRAVEQHWFLCPWLKIFYKFSLPKLLLCNSCDRKFRNYDQLYNHRHKVGHYMTKTHGNQMKSTISFVYQCEICGQWFPSIPPLQVHRNQYHPRYEMGAQCHIDLREHDNIIQQEIEKNMPREV